MTTKLLLIRHGLTQSNRDDVYAGRSEEDIGTEGYSQIEKLSIRLKDAPIAAIYSSPLKRTRSSAMRIAKDHQIQYEILKDLNEIDFGSWQGLPKEETKREWPKIWEQILLDPGKVTIPEGESFKGTMDRAIKAFEEIITSNKNQCVAVFTHEIIIKMMVMHVLKAPTTIYHHFQIDCSSVTEISINAGIPKLAYLNSLCHLY